MRLNCTSIARQPSDHGERQDNSTPPKKVCAYLRCESVQDERAVRRTLRYIGRVRRHQLLHVVIIGDRQIGLLEPGPELLVGRDVEAAEGKQLNQETL